MKKRDFKILASLVFTSISIILIQIAINLIFPKIGKLYLIPIFWIVISIYSYYRIKKHHHKFNPKKFDIRDFALIGSLIFIIIFFLSGLFVGYAKSPLNTSFIGIIKNIWIILIIPIIQEITRDNMTRKYNEVNKYCVLGVITLFFAIIDTNFYNYERIFSSSALFFDYIFKDFAIALTSSILLTYLTYRDGFKSAMLYKFPIMIAYLFAPVYPNEGNILVLVIQLLVPYLLILKIENLYDYRTVFAKALIPEKTGRGFSFLYYIVFVAFGLFTLGLFKYYPIAIISNSMLPHFARGDMIIAEKVSSSELVVDDILIYQHKNAQIVHRIIEIVERPEGKFFVTKGDNNKAPDANLITENQVRGRVIGIIPKLGYPSIKIRELIPNTNAPEDIERGNE